MNIVAVIPAYNEEARIEEAIRDAKRFVTAVVVVDDCSRDKTGEVAIKAGAHLLRHVINRGQGAALQTATDYALRVLDADVIVHFDADGQMLGEEIARLVDPIMKGEADIVLGSRFLRGGTSMPFIRKWLTLKPALIFTMLISGIRLTDTHNGFRALSRKTAEKLRITLDRMAHASEILDEIVVGRFRYVERPVTIRYTQETLKKGQSFMGGFKILADFFHDKFFDEL